VVVKTIIDEDFVNYRKPSMLIAFPKCQKCCSMCHNEHLKQMPNVEIGEEKIVQRFMSNPLTTAIVCQGLEPIDSMGDLTNLVEAIRTKSDADIVIYTGYAEDDITSQTSALKQYRNIIIKFGRYISGHQRHFDDVLGVYLASDNQYAVKIS